MKITFFGHASFNKNNEYHKVLADLLEEITKGETVEFYLGGYGGFDGFCYECCKEYKQKHKNASLIFVTPYINESYQRNHLFSLTEKFDLIIYPQIEEIPQKFAIEYRNRYMIDSSDIVILYITHSYGGAYKTYLYALKNRKNIYNIYKKDL